MYGGGGGVVAKLCPTLATPWTVAHQAPLFLGFPRQEYWSGLPLASPEDLPDPGIKPKSPANAGDAGDLSSSRDGKIPWRRAWQPSPIVLSGKSQEQRSLVGYSPWGHKRVGHD